MSKALSSISLSARTELFSSPDPGNHHSINIPPRYKVLMSACLLRLTLISPKVSEWGGGEEHWGKRGIKSCLHTQPSDVVELLSSLGCPLVSLRDAWWQRWGSESCVGLRGGGSAPLRVPCHGQARPGPCATVSGATSVSMPYAPGHCGEGARGGCHASASITIRGWSKQRLPTVTAHIAGVIAALYHILSPMLMIAGDGLPVDDFFIFFLGSPSLTNL